MRSEQLISRKALAERWSCSTETVKRRTRDGLLHPIRFNSRMIRYPLSEIIRVEKEAGGQQ
jgi:predicted site-specific integrase-resolvase